MRPLRVKKKQIYSFSKSIVYLEASPYCESGLQMQVQEAVELYDREGNGCAEIKMTGLMLTIPSPLVRGFQQIHFLTL